MSIKNLSLLSLCIVVLFSSCMKTSSTKSSNTEISEAQAFFNKSVVTGGNSVNSGNYRARQTKAVQWNQATIQHLSTGYAIVAPIHYKSTLLVAAQDAPERAFDLNDLTYLVVAADNNHKMQAYVVTFIPDTMNRPDAPSGYYFVEDWQGNSLAKPTHRAKLDSGTEAAYAPNTKEVEYVYSIQACTEIDGYNYSPDDPDGGYYWSETTCTTYNISDDGGSGGPTVPNLPGAGSAGSTVVAVAPPGNPISNIADYLSCFSNGPSPDHTYSVQICVDQPDPGTRQAWGFTSGGIIGSSSVGNIVNTGHAFLVFSENAQGNTTTRNVGFYPSTNVYPTAYTEESQGRLNNDQAHPYNISLTVQVSSTQFFNMLSYIALGNNQGFDYNLSTNNCTTFALNAMTAGGIYLPATKGAWPGGSGYDPGDLGEDIRNMALSSAMSRNTVDNAHPNTGSCNLNLPQ